MNDYRYRYGESEREDVAKRYITLGDKLPRDRKGLVMLVHPALTSESLHNDSGLAVPLHAMAKRLAIRSQQHVFFIQDEQRWLMLVIGEALTDEKRRSDFALEPGVEFIWYDDEGESDQFIGSYAPDGTWTLHGLS